MRWGNCNYEQLRAMQKRFNALQNGETDKFFRECAQTLAARLLSSVIPDTPLGEKPKMLTSKPKTVKLPGASGKSRAFLSREGAILERYWSGYVGGTLRRGWTAKSEAEAKAGKGGAKKPGDYVKTLPVKRKGRNFTITVANPVSYASYVEHGHRQTAGRYVPQIGRRLVSGIVPGKHMLYKAERGLGAKAASLLERKLKQFLEEAIQ